jgi:hypothetical protein
MENLGNADGRGIPATEPIARLGRRSLDFPLRPPATDEPDAAHDLAHVRLMAEMYRMPPPAPPCSRRRRALGRLKGAVPIGRFSRSSRSSRS